ncbi:MAG: hypothetical protein KBB32_01130 [Spirochaetia bacterium]|nr:hypothetical protein [Spirochaetia bacterium]
MRRLLPLLATVCLLAGAASAGTFSFSADSMTGAMTKGRERVILDGNAVVVSDSMTIRADRIELYGEDFRYADCSGNVSMVDGDRGLRLTTARLLYDREDKLSKLSGPSVMEDRQSGVVVKGDYIEHDDKRDIALIQINVRILKDDIVCRSEFARYDRGANTLELSGSPYVKKGSDEYRASLISVNLDTEDIVLDGSVSGTVSSAEGDDDQEAQPPQTEPGPATPDVQEPSAPDGGVESTP